ncbi:MAG: bifunctional folylpolyglutamate synthase/dihydrofolate synthase [Ignavibacteriaceae bacterium]|nr:bifunctional folylpolyglutamate synthase/dihydrofolate synthase [Ignavibacteriaceae bacterium]
MSFNNTEYRELLDFLFSLHNYGVKLGLENISAFLERIGNPHKKIKAFHVTGSNGKGSTSSFLASILFQNGFKTGLYTSPHFVKFNERIRINGEEIDDDYVLSFIKKHRAYIEETKLTFFEVTTALAFLYFAEMKVDYAVIEVGLGGRLDATNVLNPVASIITTISLEHTNVLGSTHAEIAAEKAGIIKPGVKVFTGLLNKEASDVIARKAAELQCRLFPLDEYIIMRNRKAELYTDDLFMDEVISPLNGYYQKINASLAALTINKTLGITDSDLFNSAFKNVIINTGFQGRFEIISQKPWLILDSAHNLESLVNFIKEFKYYRKKFTRVTVLFSVLKDKNYAEMIEQLKGEFDEYIVTEIKDNERAAPLDELGKVFDTYGISFRTVDDPGKAVSEHLSSNEPKSCLVVMGSMYLIGEVKKHLSDSVNNQFI